MTQEKVDMFMISNGDKLPDDKRMIVREKLLALDESRWVVICSCPMKDPTMILIISIILGGLGIDRFMLGQVGMGILKLITGGGCGIWWIIDWFLVSGETKESNFNKLMPYL